MADYYKSYSRMGFYSEWERDLWYWLKYCKGIANPIDKDLKVWDKNLNSRDPKYASDVRSFCKTTGWKYKK